MTPKSGVMFLKNSPLCRGHVSEKGVGNVSEKHALKWGHDPDKSQFKGSYSFTPRIFIQATFQYNNETEDVGSNIRFGWLNTAGTGLYVVYNDIQHLGVFDRTGFERGPKGRQLIVKYTKQFDISR